MDDSMPNGSSEIPTPGTIQWMISVALGLALFAVLLRICRVIRITSAMTLRRLAPEGMRTVQCGSCHAAQYVRLDGHIFICCGCHTANRLPLDAPSPYQELFAPTGPLKLFEFKKGGDNYWQELSQMDLPDSQDTTLVSISVEDRQKTSPVIIGNSVKDDDVETESNYGPIPQCVVCLDNPGCMVVLPCAHGSVCEACVTRIVQNRATGGVHCPHCRSDINMIVKISEIAGEMAKGIEYRIPMARVA